MIRSILKNIASRLRGNYTRRLEEEVARLRAENRALVNSILGVAGIPPMRVLGVGDSRLDDGKADADGSSSTRTSDRHFRARIQRLPNEDKAVMPLRRRSWQQIGRALEMEDALAAQRERESDTEAFPSPRNIVLRHS